MSRNTLPFKLQRIREGSSCVRTKLASCYYKALVSAPVLGAARPAATRTHLYEQLSVF